MYEWIKLENWICNFFVWKVLSEIKLFWKYLIGQLQCHQGSILSTKKLSEFWPNSQISKNFHRFSNCVPIKIFGEKFSEICPASCTKFFVKKFLRFFEKIGGFEILRFLSENLSELRFLFIGLTLGEVFSHLNKLFLEYGLLSLEPMFFK